MYGCAENYIAPYPGTINCKSEGNDGLTVQSSPHIDSTGFYRASDNQDGKEPTLSNPMSEAEAEHQQGNSQI